MHSDIVSQILPKWPYLLDCRIKVKWLYSHHWFSFVLSDLCCYTKSLPCGVRLNKWGWRYSSVSNVHFCLSFSTDCFAFLRHYIDYLHILIKSVKTHTVYVQVILEIKIKFWQFKYCLSVLLCWLVVKQVFNIQIDRVIHISDNIHGYIALFLDRAYCLSFW